MNGLSRRIPSEMQAIAVWHCWQDRDGTKFPVQIDGHPAKSNCPDTWCDFESALDAASRYSGLAFEITEPYTGVDLDDCLTDDGELREWAKPIVNALTPVAYGEISPSGRGLKFITRARKPEGSRCSVSMGGGKQGLECYDRTRFWTITGDVWGRAKNIGDGQEVIDWLCQELLTPPKTAPVPQHSSPSVFGGDLERRAQSYVDGAESCATGGRNNAAFRLAGHLYSIDEFGQRLSLEQVLNYARIWNSRNPEPLPDEELKRVVDSAGRNGTPREVKVSQPHAPAVDEDTGVNLDPLMNNLLRDAKSFPSECLEVPGLIGDLVKHNLMTAHYPLPELALAGAIALVSSVTGGKVEGLRARSNLYVMGLAPSGGGKDHARKLNRKILLHAGRPDICGPERIGSHAGVISALAENWNTMFQIDEIGRLLATMQSAQMAPHLFNIASVLLQVYSSADDIWQADAYGDRKKTKTLQFPHCVIYGTSVPDGFWESLSKQNLSEGLIGRFLVFENPDYVDYQDPVDDPIPESIIERVRNWLELKTHDGNLAGNTGHEAAHPRRVEADEQASQRLRKHAIAISDRRKKEDAVTAAIWSRHAEKTNKLALLFACSRWAPDQPWPIINGEDADRAVKLNNWLTRRMLERAGMHVSENQHERDVMRVLRIIREKAEWSLRDLNRKLRWMSRRSRHDVLGLLQESEEIVFEAKETSGRTGTVVRAL